MFFLAAYGLSNPTIAQETLLENSIGKLVLLHNKMFAYTKDKNPFGSAKVFVEFQSMYEQHIKHLDTEERVNYFWFGMWHLDFDGHYMMQFQRMIHKDCKEAFVERLNHYIQVESELDRNKSRLFLSQQVLKGIKLLK